MAEKLEPFATDTNYTGGDKPATPVKVTPSAGFMGQGQQVGVGWPSQYYNDLRSKERLATRQLQDAITGALATFRTYTDGAVTIVRPFGAEDALIGAIDAGTFRGYMPDELTGLSQGQHSAATYVPLDIAAALDRPSGVSSVPGNGGVLACNAAGMRASTVTYAGAAMVTPTGSVGADRVGVTDGDPPVWHAINSAGTYYRAVQTGLMDDISFSSVAHLMSGTPKAIGTAGDAVALVAITGTEIQLGIALDKGVTWGTASNTAGAGVSAGPEIVGDIDHGKWFFTAEDGDIWTSDLNGGNKAISLSTDLMRGPGGPGPARSLATVGNGIVGAMIKPGTGRPLTLFITADGGVSWKPYTVGGDTDSRSADCELYGEGGRFWIVDPTNDPTVIFRSVGVI